MMKPFSCGPSPNLSMATRANMLWKTPIGIPEKGSISSLNRSAENMNWNP